MLHYECCKLYVDITRWQLSRNSFKIFRSYSFFILLFSLNFSCCSKKCIYIFIADHNKSCNGHYSKQQTNQVHLAKFKKLGIVTSLLNIAIRVYIHKIPHSALGRGVRIDSTSE